MSLDCSGAAVVKVLSCPPTDVPLASLGLSLEQQFRRIGTRRRQPHRTKFGSLVRAIIITRHQPTRAKENKVPSEHPSSDIHGAVGLRSANFDFFFSSGPTLPVVAHRCLFRNHSIFPQMMQSEPQSNVCILCPI